MNEEEKTFIYLQNVVKNITTPYEFHHFEDFFSKELAMLTPPHYDEIMKLYRNKKSVLVQENARAEDVVQLGMYYLYQAYSDDKRITQMAEKLYSLLDLYQEKADENGISLYDQLMRDYGNQYFFEFKLRINVYMAQIPRGIRKQQRVQEVEQKEEKKELPVVAIPPEIINRLSSIEEELQRTNEKINEIFSEIVKKITSETQPIPKPSETVQTRRRERREFSDEIINLYKRYIGIAMNDINLASFNKFINEIKRLYHRRAVEMKDLQSILDEVDFAGVRNAIIKHKSISEAFNEALKDLMSKVRPDTMTEEEQEYEEAREESGIFDRYGERLDVLVEQLYDLVNEYRIAQNENDENEMNSIRETMRRMFYVETDEDFREAMENPREYIVKRWKMFFR
jgi:hypothetical protein